MNICELISNNQQQTFEKFQDNFSPYKKNHSEINVIKKKFSESNFIHDECKEYYKKASMSPNKLFKGRSKEEKTIKTDKNVGKK